MRPADIIIMLILFLVPGCNKNEVPKPDDSGLFVKLFGNSSSDAGFSVAELSDGSGFIITGSTIGDESSSRDILIARLDNNGNEVWKTRYGASFDDEGMDVLAAGDGSIIIPGYQEGAEGTSDLIVLKLDPETGKVNDLVTLGAKETDEKGLSISESSDGSFIVLGAISSSDGPGTEDMLLGRISADLSEVSWERKLGVRGLTDESGTVKELPDGDLVWCGTVRDGSSRLRIARSDAYGNMIWSYEYYEQPDTDHSGHALDVLPGGSGFIAAGETGAGMDQDIYLVRTDQNGMLLPDAEPLIFEKEGAQKAGSVIVTSDGRYVITGHTIGKDNDKQVYVAAFDSKAMLLWEQEFGGAGEDKGHMIMETSGGDFLVIGTVTVSNNPMIAVYKISSRGELIRAD